MITTTNPADGTTIAEYARHDDGEVEARLARSWTRFTHDWRTRPLEDRTDLLERLADVLDDRTDELARLMTAEMGKPIRAARSEVEKCAWLCRHYAETAETYLAGRSIQTDAAKSYVRYDPMGPILAVMPWNFPLWQVFRFLVPNVVGGNTCLLRHASNVTGTALEIERMVAEAGGPDGLFTTLLCDHDTVESIIGDRRVRGVTLTGSDVAGRAVAAAAGRNLKPSVMELGGSDPFVVLDDADLDLAAQLAVDSRYLNSGQSCINAKRLIVAASRYEDFLDALVQRVKGLVVGDPTEESTDIGPLASEGHRDTVADQVHRTLVHRNGGEALVGATMIDGPGAFYAPTVIRDVNPEAPAASEEVFGPVSAVMSAADDDVAVALANATRFGLGAAIITGDDERGEAVAAQIDAGMVFVNQLVKSDPRLPFGGVKDSGYGRELSQEGAVAFLNTKLVWVD